MVQLPVALVRHVVGECLAAAAGVRAALPAAVAAIVFEYDGGEAGVWGLIAELPDDFHQNLYKRLMGPAIHSAPFAERNLPGITWKSMCNQNVEHSAPFRATRPGRYQDERRDDYCRLVCQVLLPSPPRAPTDLPLRYAAALYSYVCITQPDLAPASFAAGKSPLYYILKKPGTKRLSARIRAN